MSTRTKKIWRLLEPGEAVKQGDETFQCGAWLPTSITIGCELHPKSPPFRRQVEIPAPHPFDEWFETYNKDASHVAYEPACIYAWNAAIDAAISGMERIGGNVAIAADVVVKELKK